MMLMLHLRAYTAKVRDIIVRWVLQSIRIMMKCFDAMRNLKKSDINNNFSYHDLHITTKYIDRKSIFDLPYGYELSCSRVRGWTLWFNSMHVVAGEYEGEENWLVLDVNGYVILDSRLLKLDESDV